MKDWLILVTENAIIIVDALALVVILAGTIEAFIAGLRLMFGLLSAPGRREAWLNYARWLIAGLTFQLAADIIETSITASWEAVGRLAAVAVIRTFLNYFLKRDLTEGRTRERAGAT